MRSLNAGQTRRGQLSKYLDTFSKVNSFTLPSASVKQPTDKQQPCHYKLTLCSQTLFKPTQIYLKLNTECTEPTSRLINEHDLMIRALELIICVHDVII